MLAEEVKQTHQELVTKEGVAGVAQKNAAEKIEMSAVVSSHEAAAGMVSAGDVNIEVVEEEKRSAEDAAKSGKPLWTGNEFETFV